MKIETQLEDAICLAALEVSDPVQRKSFLERACAGDDRLRSKVEEMLVSHKDAEQFFARGKSAVASAQIDFSSSEAVAPNELHTVEEVDRQIGIQVGRYKLLQKLGEGGCGTVYMAEQEEPVRRRVAVKIIKPGMDTKSVIARFEAERQALAMMDHPNIARVLDAGETESGRPYFVMELVRGLRITKFCDENNFDTHQRLELFIQACRAIQHAHQKGIIHRDIKPSNILVTLHDGVPVPKVIDFGIAKATEGRLTENTMFTAYEQFLGTPAYMSPEQAEMSGLDVDTRSDVYSLGVLLYELLTGRTPFDSKTLMASGFDEMRKTLREKEPPAPSTMITSLQRTEQNTTAVRRHVEAPKLISQLKGDLDWIVLKSLEKDRTRRYETVNGLAMDVQRYLDNEPVVARPPSRTYRLQKLVRRNKIVFASGFVVAVTLLFALAALMLLFFHEREARREEGHLRAQAEQAERRENELREQAEAREKINQAAIFVTQEKFDEANRLLEEVKTPPPKPSLDGISAYRSVGEWLAVKGRWQEAARRYMALMEIDKLDKWSPVTLDYQACGAVLAESGDRDQFAQFCKLCVDGYGTTTNGDAAGRILRTCLLLPSAPALLQQMKGMGDINEKYVSSSDFKPNAWVVMSPTLWCYRNGDYEKAARWCSIALNPNDKISAQHATLRIMLAMSDFQTGKTNEAQFQLSIARNTVSAKFQKGDRGNTGTGMWFDWAFAQVLLREAEVLMANHDDSPDASLPQP